MLKLSGVDYKFYFLFLLSLLSFLYSLDLFNTKIYSLIYLCVI